MQCTFSWFIFHDECSAWWFGSGYFKCACTQCVIDLRRNVLVIGTTGTETRFLTESELPECARLALVGGSDPRSLSGGYSPSPVPAQATPSVTEVEDRDLAEALQQSAYESSE